jgi:hypothetical protein
MIICMTGKTGFKFYNEFDYETNTDALYYILSILEKVELKKADAKILLGGYIEKESEVFKLLYRYLEDVSLVNIEKLIVANDTTNTHSYFDHYLNIHS